MIQTQKTKDMVDHAPERVRAVDAGQERLCPRVHVGQGQEPVDVGKVTLSTSMAMPGMAPMIAGATLTPDKTPGRYLGTISFPDSGARQVTVTLGRARPARARRSSPCRCADEGAVRAGRALAPILLALRCWSWRCPRAARRSARRAGEVTVDELVTRALADNPDAAGGARRGRGGRGPAPPGRPAARTPCSTSAGQKALSPDNNLTVGRDGAARPERPEGGPRRRRGAGGGDEARAGAPSASAGSAPTCG